MQTKEFQGLTKFHPALLDAGITVDILSTSGKRLIALGSAARRPGLTIRIIMGPYNPKLEDPRFDTYFCTTLEEAEQIVTYVAPEMHAESMHRGSRDALDAVGPDLISLDDVGAESISADEAVRRF